MAVVRYYLPSTGAAAVSPAFDSGWEDSSTVSPARYPTDTVKSGAAMASVTAADTPTGSTNADMLFGQWVSNVLPAQTVAAQTIVCVVRCREAFPNNNLFLAVGVRAVSENGSSVLATLLAVTRDNTEATTSGTLQSRSLSASISDTVISQNFRLVIEIGLGGTNIAISGNHDGSVRIGDAAANDLDNSDADTGDDNPWIEINIALAATGASHLLGGKIIHGSLIQGGLLG